METSRRDKRTPAVAKHPRSGDSRSARKRIAIDAHYNEAAGSDYMPIRFSAAIDIVERTSRTLGVDRDTTAVLLADMKSSKPIRCIDDVSVLASLLLGETLCDGTRISTTAAVLATLYADRHGAIRDDRLIAHMVPVDTSGLLFAVSVAYAHDDLRHIDAHEHVLVEALRVQQTEPRTDILMRFLGTCQPSCGGAIVSTLASFPGASDNTRTVVHVYVNGVY